jgi:methylglutaconyl-CoA hydratase
MKYETIEITIKNNVATVTLNRPDVHNAMNETLMKELTSCFKNLNNDNKTKIIILTGKGKSFSAGADLNWMKSMINYSKEDNIEDSRLLLNLYEIIYKSPKPTIGHINGHAFGGGIGLIAVCDITIAPPNKLFAFSEVKLGIIPSVISTYIGKRIGKSNMRRLFITGEKFDSQYAKKIGLIDFVIPEEDVDKTIQKNIEYLKTSGPNAIIEIKKLIEKYDQIDNEKYKEHTVEKISELRVSSEGQEGIKAFLEKRKTNWSE